MNAFDIEINGQFVDLPETNFRYEVVNALFTNEIYQGDFSFPYDLPATDKNLKIFGFVNYIHTKNKITEIESAFIYIFGIKKYNAKLKVSRSNEKSISITLNGGIRALKNSEKLLSDVVSYKTYTLGNTQDEVLAKAKTISGTGDWKVYGFCFVPFHAPNFYDGKNPYFLGVCNRVNSTNGDFLGNGFTYINNKYNLVGWIFLFELLNEVFKDAGLTPTGTFWNNAECAKILLFSNKAIELRPKGYNSKMVNYTSVVYSTTGDNVDVTVGPRNSYDNPLAWDDVNKQYIIKNAGEHLFVFTADVYVLTTAFVEPLKLKGGGFTFWFDGVQQEYFELPGESGYRWVRVKNMSFSAGDIGKACSFKYQRPGGSFQNQTYVQLDFAQLEVIVTPNVADMPSTPETTVNFKDMVANWTVIELLTEVKKYGVDFNFDSPGIVKMDIAQDIVDAYESIDLTGRASKPHNINFEDRGKGTLISYAFPASENATIEISPDKLIPEVFGPDQLGSPAKEGTYVVTTSTNEVFQVIKDDVNPNTWKKIGYNYRPYKIGNGETELSCRLAPMQMCYAANQLGSAAQNKALMPYYPGIGSSDLFGLGNNEFDFRLVFWRGYNITDTVENPKGGTYVLASTGLHDINGNVRGNYCFRLDKQEALIRKNSETILNIMNESELIEKELDLNAKKLSDIKSTSKLLVDFSAVLIKSLTIIISKSTVRVKAYLYKI